MSDEVKLYNLAIKDVVHKGDCWYYSTCVQEKLKHLPSTPAETVWRKDAITPLNNELGEAFRLYDRNWTAHMPILTSFWVYDFEKDVHEHTINLSVDGSKGLIAEVIRLNKEWKESNW